VHHIVEWIILEVSYVHFLGEVDKALELDVEGAYEIVLLADLVEHILQTIIRQKLLELEGVESQKVELLHGVGEEVIVHVC